MVEIRRADSGDIEAILPLVAAYRVFYRQLPDDARERAYVMEMLATSKSVVLLASRDDRVLGFAQLFTTFNTVHLAPSLILEDLFVAPEARGNGVATRLLNAAVDYARSVGASGMFLETAMDNASAQRVYERALWTREARFLKYNAPLATDARMPAEEGRDKG